jgi:DNA-binding MarR family transcriptional regulator
MFGLTPPQWRVLRVLREQDGQTISAISAAALFDRPVVVGVVDRLAAAGLVVRQRSEQDRRQVFVLLTDKGRDLLAEATPHILEVYRALDDALTEREWNTLFRLLERVRNHDMNAAESAESSA